MSALFGSSKPAKPKDGDSPPPLSPTDPSSKPLPAIRPGTSGTENLLITNRRAASEQLAKAQHAERAYRSRKQAARARTGLGEARGHFREAFSHFGSGIRGVWAVARAAPYLLGEMKENRQKRSDARRRQKHFEQKKKLEEELARRRQEEDGESDGEEDERVGRDGRDSDSDSEAGGAGAEEAEREKETGGKKWKGKGKGKGKGKY